MSGGQTPILRLSHILIRVADLEAAVGDYQAMGFTVVFGSERSTARNAFIRLAGGQFLELYAPPPLDQAARKAVEGAFGRAAADRFQRWAEPDEGVRDYCVEAETFDIGSTVERIRAAGVAISDPFPFGRTRPDGVVLQWRLAFPEDVSLPFVMGAYDPPDAPASADLIHSNGASKLSRFSLRRPSVAGPDDPLERLLGQAPSAAGIFPGDETFLGLGGLTAALPQTLLHQAKIVGAQGEPDR